MIWLFPTRINILLHPATCRPNISSIYPMLMAKVNWMPFDNNNFV